MNQISAAMHDGQLFADLAGDFSVSFEFFPPKTEKMDAALWDCVQTLASFGPRFVTVTYGADGSTRAHTHDIVTRIIKQTNLPAAAHLTCVGAEKHEILEIASSYWAAGIRHIVALRGDPPRGSETCTPTSNSFANAAALTAGLRRIAPFEISVAAYPEGHPDSPNLDADLDNLKAKIDAGAARAITQFFFSSETFLRFRDRAAARGINAEIVPGILPVANVAQTRKFAAQCGAVIPPWMNRLFEGLDDQPETRQLVAATITAEMCKQLYDNGVRNFHFYTLNRAALSGSICHLLGKKRKTDQMITHPAAA